LVNHVDEGIALELSGRPSHQEYGIGASQANGFGMVQTPMFINCPNIGTVGSEVVEPAVEYATSIKLGRKHVSLILKEGIAVAFETRLYRHRHG
jgi:hypothetical protein